MTCEENRRHKRLMSRAARLDLEDLLEIAAAKQWTGAALDAVAGNRASSSGSASNPDAEHAAANAAAGEAAAAGSAPAREEEGGDEL